MQFNNKVVLITGSGRGIGKAIATRFCEQGAKVIVNYRSAKEKAEVLCRELKQNGGEAWCVQADIASKSSVDNMFKVIAEREGQLDVLVNNAGWAKQQSLGEIDAQDLERQLMTNVAGLIFCSQAASPLLKEHGRIINISSIAAKGGAAFPVYSATKAACNTLTKSLAAEFGSRHITVNAVAPAAVETDLYYSVGLDKNRELSLATTPLGFLGDVKDVAEAVLFFASAGARWITGEILHVSGGKMM